VRKRFKEYKLRIGETKVLKKMFGSKREKVKEKGEIM
jgi:hypothetical protein